MKLFKKVWKFFTVLVVLTLAPWLLTGRPESCSFGFLIGSLVAIAVLDHLQCPGCGSWNTRVTGYRYEFFTPAQAPNFRVRLQDRKCRHCGSVYYRETRRVS
jgi:hypothetical protein